MSAPRSAGRSRGGHGLSVDQLRTSKAVKSIASESLHRDARLSSLAASAQKESLFHVEAGSVLRQESEARRSRASELGVSVKQRSDEAIRERVKKTQEQKQALQDILRDLLEHSENLETVSAEVDELLGLEGEMVTKLREVIRERRTRHRQNPEEVDFWLKAVQAEMEASLFPKFHSDLVRMCAALTKISPELTQAIEDKADSVVVDLECLSMDTSNVAHKALAAPAPRGAAHLEPRSTRKQQAVTESLLQRADLQAQHASSLDQKLLGYRARRCESEPTNSLLQAFSDRVLEGETSVLALEDTLAQVEEDLDSCNEELGRLSECIGEHSDALQVTQTRMRTRQTKPARERVRDQADRALESEEDLLMKEITRLHLQQKKLKSNRAQLQTSITQLRKELGNKQEALGGDREAHQLFEAMIDELNSLLQPAQ